MDFRTRIMEHVPRLRRYARALLEHRERADDLVQETIERAVSNAKSFTNGVDLRAWLFAIMHEAFLDRMSHSMNEPQNSISEEDIHAYVDGALSVEERARVERAIEVNPALAARVSDYFLLNHMIHERYDRILREPIPSRLHLPNERRGFVRAQWPRLAAVLTLGIGIGIGIAAGMEINHSLGLLGDGPEEFVHQATVAHVVYMPSAERPADFGPDREQDFAQYLADKLGTGLRPPLLEKNGFELTGGRVLPGSNGPTVQFMYRDASGERVTLCISRRVPSTDATAFKLHQDGPVNVFYWADGGFGFAISGGIDRQIMLELAHDVYAQLTASTPG